MLVFIVFLCVLPHQVSKNGMVNSVFTLYELSNGEDTESEGKLSGFVQKVLFGTALSKLLLSVVLHF